MYRGCFSTGNCEGSVRDILGFSSHHPMIKSHPETQNKTHLVSRKLQKYLKYRIYLHFTVDCQRVTFMDNQNGKNAKDDDENGFHLKSIPGRIGGR